MTQLAGLDDYLVMTMHLGGALVAGGMIGIERSFHGRPAGFRTHTLVCVASSLLMLVSLYQWAWLPGGVRGTVTDPTRMAQGIMTGIGFLGAGVIYREGLSVRGLTTAASIWITAAIGILFGIGFYFPAVLATVLTLGVLAVFRRIEDRMPVQHYAHHHIRFEREQTMSEAQLRALLAEHGFTVFNLSYRVTGDGRFFEYRMVLRGTDPASLGRFSEAMRLHPLVREFRVSPAGD